MKLTISKKDLKWIILCMAEGIGEFHHLLPVHGDDHLEFHTKYFCVTVAFWFPLSEKERNEIEQFETIVNECVKLLQNKHAIDFDKVMDEVEKICPFNENPNLYFHQMALSFMIGGGREEPEPYLDYVERTNGGEEDA